MPASTRDAIRDERLPRRRDWRRINGSAQLVQPHERDAREHQDSPDSLYDVQPLAEQEPGEGDREQDLGQADERRNLRTKPARRRNARAEGDDTGDDGHAEYGDQPADVRV